MVMARALVVLPLAALIAIGAVRAMTFIAPFDHPLRGLEAMFAGHPEAATNRAMTEIGTAAANGQGVPPSARTAIADVSTKAPLAPDPFLVEGTIAQMAGDAARAERLFLAARERDPRSEAARYFLADLYFKTDRIMPGLIEMGALARLSEQASQPLVPALAAYARSPGAIPRLRRFFELSPRARESTLVLLAADPRNTSLVFALAAPGRPGDPGRAWHEVLIKAHVASGDYAGAQSIWARVSGVNNRGLLYNPQFRKVAAPPPFNWSYASGSAGVAEASGGGGLQVIHYGREQVTLASQMLRLSPGGYRLSMRVDGPSRVEGVAWTLLCLPGNQAMLQLPVTVAGSKSISGSFAVPAAGCTAQSLELRGSPRESPETAQFTILDVKLEPLAAGS